MASKISRKLGLGGRLIAFATGSLSRLGTILADLHTNDASNREVVNKLRSDVIDARARITELTTLTTELKQKHNATDTAANAGAQQVGAAVASALAGLLANADATISTELVD